MAITTTPDELQGIQDKIYKEERQKFLEKLHESGKDNALYIEVHKLFEKLVALERDNDKLFRVLRAIDCGSVHIDFPNDEKHREYIFQLTVDGKCVDIKIDYNIETRDIKVVIY